MVNPAIFNPFIFTSGLKGTPGTALLCFGADTRVRHGHCQAARYSGIAGIAGPLPIARKNRRRTIQITRPLRDVVLAIFSSTSGSLTVERLTIWRKQIVAHPRARRAAYWQPGFSI